MWTYTRHGFGELFANNKYNLGKKDNRNLEQAKNLIVRK